MILRLFFATIKWIVALALVGGLLSGAYVVHQRTSEQRTPEGAGDSAQESKRPGEVKLGAELALSHGLKDEPAQAARWVERTPVYGRVIPNPAATVEIRAPFAGTLRLTPGGTWPAPGGRVQSGQILGWLDVRVGPQERLDLVAKLNEARLKQQGAEVILKIRAERVEGLNRVSTPNVISGKELDEFQVQLADAKTALRIANDAVTLWQNALAEIDRHSEQKNSTWSQPLTAPADGEVTELVGRPGMVMEAGGLVARLVDFRRTLVRLDIPPDVLGAAPPSKVYLFANTLAPPAFRGAANQPQPEPPARPVPATLLGAAPQVDAASQFAGYLYEVNSGSTHQVRQSGNNSSEHVEESPQGAEVWRPWLLVKAYLETRDAKPRTAVSVPATALLYHQGRALVYVRLSPGRYERREVQVLGRDGDRIMLATGVAADEPVVFRQAQVLLSEEFRQQGDND